MSILKLTGLIYGILLIGGGFMGLKAGSKVSLIMGIVSGVLALVGSFIVDKNFSTGAWTLLVVSGVLCIVFLMRLLKTGKFMPSGMLLSLSAIVLVVVLSQLFSR